MWDFGPVELLEPEAIGEPGERTFRLRVMRGNDAASLWLEKEHLIALAMAIRQLLEQTPEEDTKADAGPPLPIGDFPDQPDVDFKLGKLGIGYDEQHRMVTIFAYERADDDDDASPTFACQISRRQSKTFAEKAEEAIAAGRPLCVLCGGPVEHGEHRCGRRNGHSRMPISLADEGDSE